MDYIVKKMNSRIDISGPGTVKREMLLRERVEYILYLVLGCLWNANISNVGQEMQNKIIKNLYNMSIGEVVGAIRDLDRESKYFVKSELKVFDKYPTLRNEKFGHGYINESEIPEMEKQMDELYQELIGISFISKKYSLVRVNKFEEGKYVGVRFDFNSGGDPEIWSCQKNVLGDIAYPSVFLYHKDEKQYFRVTPFIEIDENGENIYVFQSLKDKLSGNVKMCQLLRGTQCEMRFPELVNISANEEHRIISSNGTIMNKFETNYSKFIVTPIESEIEKFLKNESNVHATIWGHGGVGKTACIQNVCMNKFNDIKRQFDYIVFTSAKARRYDPSTGKVVEISNLRSFEEVIDTMIAVLSDEEPTEPLEKKIEQILSTTSKVLLVVDDFETFPDEEKVKIQEFINKLSLVYFKVVTTTRNRHLSTGEQIATDDFKGQDTKNFLLKIFENEYPEHLRGITKVLEDEEAMACIQEATSGRAIFLYQFANIFAQRGYAPQFLSELKDSESARDFLYGKIYNCLSAPAQLAFVCISRIADEQNLIFRERILEYLMKDGSTTIEEITAAIQELADQKIIEAYDDGNYRIYTKELFALMQDNFKNQPMPFKDRIKSKLADLGGVASVTGSVYEAMLNEAKKAKDTRNVQLAIDRFKRLLNNPECEVGVKKKALIGLASFVNNDMVDVVGAIKVFDEYIHMCNFENDVDVIKLYTQYLWSGEAKSKARACEVMEAFFKRNKKTAPANLDLFAVAVLYCSSYVVESSINSVGDVATNAGYRIFNEYGRELYRYIKDKELRELKSSERHNVSLALIQTARLALNLPNSKPIHDEYVREIIAYGEKNFDPLIKNQLKTLKRLKPKSANTTKATATAQVSPTVSTGAETVYKKGDIVVVEAVAVQPTFVLAKIDEKEMGMITQTAITEEHLNSLQVGDLLRAKVTGRSGVKYYMLVARGIPQDNLQ